MALTTLTWTPTSWAPRESRDAHPTKLARSFSVAGNEAFTGATLAVVSGNTRLLILPTAAVDDGVAFSIRIDPRSLNPGVHTATVRVTKNAVTADMVVTAHIRPANPPRRG